MEKKNLFCNLDTLKNESDVEQFFAIKLIKHLGYDEKFIKTKTSLDELVISKGSKKEKYKPDYVLFSDGKPKIVIDAKSPTEIIDDYTYQVSGYALELNKRFKGENPVRFAVLTNGKSLKVYNWDEEEAIVKLSFEDFSRGNEEFKRLIDLLSAENIEKRSGKNELSIEIFLSRPSVEEVKASFNKCHNIIWKKEKISPTDAFYEFSKIIFVKLNEDKRIRNIIDKKQTPKRSDFKFSIDWIDERETETENPVSSILFSELRKDLQEQVEKNKKKSIFQKDEEIDLKSPTIREVVRVLQNYDLYMIDEDLNGRMFETFLNATIRGRELGQYFTPRKIVKFMTKLADLKIIKDGNMMRSELVLDACCGSGGFLIDAMADLVEKIKDNKSLRDRKEEIINNIKMESLFGIEANPKISRIARMNMYVHGDGGSRIYCADSLDKNLLISKGTHQETKRELEELKQKLDEGKLRFDVVLTNPPFSMHYQTKDKDEKTVLEEYGEIAYKKGTNELKPSVQSNVLFVARYVDFLKEGGRMFIILDNSVLNSDSNREYRDFIREKFLVKAVFQLPTHAFVNQEAGGITSILYLEKRKGGEQQQPHVFARYVENIGHTKSGKEEKHDDFESVLKEYRKYEETGKLYKNGSVRIGDYEDDDLFLMSPDSISDRFDVFFHQPSYRQLLVALREREKQGKCTIKKLEDFEKIKNISKEEKDEDKVYKYIEIGNLNKERGVVDQDELQEGMREFLPDRAKLLLKENDLLFSKPYRSLKKVVVIPKHLDGELGSSGFYGIRPKNPKEAFLLWALFRSELVQKQFRHLASGYTQRELNDEYLKEYFIIPIPRNTVRLERMIDNNIEIAEEARRTETKALSKIEKEPEKILNISL